MILYILLYIFISFFHPPMTTSKLLTSVVIAVMTSSSVFATDVGTFSQEESTVATMPSRVSISSIESVDAVELHKIPTTLKPLETPIILETPIVIKSVDVVEIDTTPSVKSATGIVVPEVSVELKTVDVRDTLITMDTAGLEQLADQ